MVDAPIEHPGRTSRVERLIGRELSRLHIDLLTLVAIAAIVTLGGTLRFHGLGWDQPEGPNTVPLQMHPDERFLSIVASAIEWPAGPGEYFNTQESQLNPLNSPDINHFVYGTFPIFLAKAVATAADEDNYSNVVQWGRATTAAIDSLTILFVFGIGVLLFGRSVGLLAALFYALAVLPTQLAHFWTVDPYVTFFGALTMLLSLLWVRDGRPWWLLLAAVAVGLGLASKVTAWPTAMIPALAFVIRVGLRDWYPMRLRWRGEPAGPDGTHVRTRRSDSGLLDFALLCACGIVALVVFRIFQPYAFAGPGFFDVALDTTWKDGIFQEVDFQNGNADFPPFVQFAQGTPFLTPLVNLVVWGTGPALGIAGFAGMGIAGFLAIRRRELSYLLPLAYAAGILLFQGPRFVAFMRYFVPLYPVLCLFAAWLLLGMVAHAPLIRDRLAARLPRLSTLSTRTVRRTAIGLTALVVASTAFWAFAFQSVYSQTHPRIAASEWVYENVPPGATISNEIWDDSIPYPLPGYDAGQYVRVPTEPYRTDSPEKMVELVYGTPDTDRLGLDDIDYFVIASNRVRDSVPNLQLEYPAQIAFYEMLDSGELGFERVATFKVHPTFLGISIDDSGAEESFTVYDHPEVRIYQKTADFEPQRVLALLLDAYPERATNLLPRQGASNGIQFTPEEAATQQAGGTFMDVFNPGGWANTVPWLWWLLWLEIAAFAALGWSTWLFRALPDRGFGLSKVAGIISVTLPVWLVVAWGAADFTRGIAWGVFALVAVVGFAAAYLRRDAILREARQNWPAWLLAEGVFLAAFFGFLALRAWNPDAWNHPLGGEKPMELAYLTAVTRSTELPPYDPWFAGGYLNYYYMGWFFMAVPMRALQIVPEIAFNLGVPTFASLAAVTAFSVVTNLVALSQRARAGIPRPGRRALVAGLWGTVLLVAIGNLDGAHQTIERFQAVNTWGLFEGTPVLGGAVGIVGGIWQWLFHDAQLPRFDWWRSSRAHIGAFDITEFPYFSFLFADLHPHLMAIPFFVFLVGTATTYAASVRRGLDRQPWVLAAVLGAMVGLVRMIHTWDFPTAVIIVTGSIVLAALFARGQPGRRFWHAAGHLTLAGAFALLPYLPFTSHFETFETGISRAPETTPINQHFAHFGLFFVIGIVFLAVRYREEVRAAPNNVITGLFATPLTIAAAAIFVLGLVVFSWPFGITTIVLSAVAVVLLLNLMWREWRSPEPDIARLLVTAFYALAISIAAGVDVVTIGQDIVRMNTVFKFSLQAWHLFALASGYATWYALSALWAERPSWDMAGSRREWLGRQAAPLGATAAIVVVALVASIYLWSGTPVRQAVRFDPDIEPTLNGLAYLEEGDPVYIDNRGNADAADDVPLDLDADLPLIYWLRENVEGTPVIVEAPGNLYSWASRISINTGLPTVIGWDWHQTQQRFDYAHLIGQRRADAFRFYQDPDPVQAQQFLRKYNVSYVVVGLQELITANPEALAGFANIDALTEVFRDGDHAIYRVDQSALPYPVPLEEPAAVAQQ